LGSFVAFRSSPRVGKFRGNFDLPHCILDDTAAPRQASHPVAPRDFFCKPLVISDLVRERDEAFEPAISTVPYK